MLETQLNELQAERLKIYSSQAQKGKAQVNVFPPISHSPQNQAQQQPHPHPQRQQTNSPEPPGGVHPAVAMLNHIEKLRNNLKEREYEVHSLRHENSTLKQIERRHQKDLKDLQGQNDDAPRVVQVLREENTAIKQKLKEYYMHLAADQRQIRSLNKEVHALRAQKQALDTLVHDQELDERKSLTEKLASVEEQLDEQTLNGLELLRKTELMQKNFNNEAKHLRGKIHSLEQERGVLKERAEKLVRDVKEKDKEVASLSIYRYNAIHRRGGFYEQQDGSSCKVCAKRERNEEERRRREAIMARLPLLEMKELQVLDAMSVKVDIIVPIHSIPPPTSGSLTASTGLGVSSHVTRRKSASPFRPETGRKSDSPRSSSKSGDLISAEETPSPEYSEIVIQCCSDPSFPNGSEDPNAAILYEARFDASLFESKPQTLMDARDMDKPMPPPPKSVDHSHTFHQLNPNVTYYFKAYAVNADVTGPSTIQNIVCDLVPVAPIQAPRCTQHPHDRSIVIKMDKIARSKNMESEVTKYMIYHSLSPDMREKYLVGEISAPFAGSAASEKSENHASVPDNVEFCYKGADILVDHYFCYSGANDCGEGPVSSVSEALRVGLVTYTFMLNPIIDFLPSRPAKPILARPGGDRSDTVIRVVTTVEPNGSSDPKIWSICIFKVLESGETESPIVLDIPVVSEEQLPPEQEPDRVKIELADASEEEAQSASLPRLELTKDSDSVVTPHQLSYLVTSLAPGRYHVRVLVSNAMGKSPASFSSEDIDLELKIPIPTSLPTFAIISPTSVTFNFTDISMDFMTSATPIVTRRASSMTLDQSSVSISSTSGNNKKQQQQQQQSSPTRKVQLAKIAGVPVKQRKLYSSFEPDMQNAVPEGPILDFTQQTVTLSKLSPGQQYYFAMSYIGPKGDEGRKSRPIFVPLAAAIALPESRHMSTANLSDSNRPSVGQRLTGRDSYASISSSMANLSQRERWGNMHNGMPANHSESSLYDEAKSMTPPMRQGSVSVDVPPVVKPVRAAARGAAGAAKKPVARGSPTARTITSLKTAAGKGTGSRANLAASKTNLTGSKKFVSKRALH